MPASCVPTNPCRACPKACPQGKLLIPVNARVTFFLLHNFFTTTPPLYTNYKSIIEYREPWERGKLNFFSLGLLFYLSSLLWLVQHI